MTPTQVRQAEKLLVRLALIKTARGALREASEFRLSIITRQSGMPSIQVVEFDRPAAADMLDQQDIDLRRQLEALGVTQIDGGA